MKEILTKYRNLCIAINKVCPAIVTISKIGYTLYCMDQFGIDRSGLMHYSLKPHWALEELHAFIELNYNLLPKLYTIKL